MATEIQIPTPAEVEPLVVTKRQLAAKLQTSTRFIERLVQEGRIPVLRIGKNCVRFETNAVLAALR